MAAAAEGLAGWYCRRCYGWDFSHRPARVTPDLVFQEPSTNRYALIEVKSSSKSGNIQAKLTTDMIKPLGVLGGTKLIRPGLYYAGLILVQVGGPTDVRLTSLLLEEV